jgi:hypothetical protein
MKERGEADLSNRDDALAGTFDLDAFRGAGCLGHCELHCLVIGESELPASSRQTVQRGSSDKRAASAQPAVPPPTTT